MADTQSWIGVAHDSLGNLEEAAKSFSEAINELAPIVARNQSNKEWAVQLANIRQLEARLHLSRGFSEEAKTSITLALKTLELVANEQAADNRWIYRLASAHQIAGDCERALGDPRASEDHYAKSLGILKKIEGDGTDARQRRLKAVIRLALVRLGGRGAGSNELGNIARELGQLNADAPNDEHIAHALADALLLFGEQHRVRGDAGRSREAWRRVLDLADKRAQEKLSPPFIAARAIARLRLEGATAASKDIDSLASIGYQQIDYLNSLRETQ